MYLLITVSWLITFSPINLYIDFNAPPEPPKTTVDPAFGCPDEMWSAYGDSCYMMNSAMTEFDPARTLCQMQSSDLVSIRDMNENNFVMSMVYSRKSVFHLYSIMLLFRLACCSPHCRFDGDFCTTVQVSLAAEERPSGKQHQDNQLITHSGRPQTVDFYSTWEQCRSWKS